MRYFKALLALCAFAGSLDVGAAQTPALSEAAKALVGTWEFTNADRDKVCTVTFRTDRSTAGMKVDFDRTCVNVFPFVREVAGWTMGENDFLRLVNAQGRSVLDFSEVESGVYEAPRPGEGILFIQNAGAAGPAPRTAEQIAGDWQVVRGSTQPICTLTLSNTTAGAELALRVIPPCDGAVTRFAPTTWQVDRGELLLKSARGQTWRFEESGEATWRRVPEGADPITLVRK
jgi:hypothetical protein